jgi:hypothetical protein
MDTQDTVFVSCQDTIRHMIWIRKIQYVPSFLMEGEGGGSGEGGKG